MTLKEVASNMHKNARRNGAASCKLSGGLKLKLFYRKQDVVLKLSRDNVEPSDVELRTCKTYFFGEKAAIANRAQQDHSIYISVKRKTRCHESRQEGGDNNARVNPLR